VWSSVTLRCTIFPTNSSPLIHLTVNTPLAPHQSHHPPQGFSPVWWTEFNELHGPESFWRSQQQLSAGQEFLAFDRAHRFFTMFTVHTFTPYFFKIHFTIILSPIPASSKWCASLQPFQQKLHMHFSFSHVCHMPHPAHLTWLHCITTQKIHSVSSPAWATQISD
jgi:hypothetical protein